MDLSEIINRVIAAIVLATLTGLAGAVLASQSGVSAGAPPSYAPPDQVGARDSGQGPTITGGTHDGGSRHGRGFVVVDLPDRRDGLTPGGSQQRWIRITNPNRVDIVVTRLSATVGLPVAADGAPAGTCLPIDLAVEPLAEPVTVPANGSVEVALVARLDAAAPSTCTDAHFPLTYSGVASTP